MKYQTVNPPQAEQGLLCWFCVGGRLDPFIGVGFSAKEARISYCKDRAERGLLRWSKVWLAWKP